MEDNFLLKIILGLLAVITGIIGFNLRSYKSDYDKLQDDHQGHKLNVSENYAKKNDLNAARLETTSSIARLHDKIEDSTEKLNTKIDGMPDKIVNLMMGHK